MMYNNKLVAAIKVGGKVLREFGDVVRLPFGSEYEIMVKNLHNTRALVTIEIDGTDIGNGTQFVIRPGQTVDFKRFVEQATSSHGNAFKFIERTSKIENHRGVGAEDGLITVKFQFERQPSQVYDGGSILRNYINQQSGPSWTNAIGKSVGDFYSGPRGISSNVSGSLSSDMSANAIIAQSQTLSSTAPIPVNDVGITVRGSEVHQEFTQCAAFALDYPTYTMVIKLAGDVEQPVTVKSKLQCPTCGEINPWTNKFCADCGTALLK